MRVIVLKIHAGADSGEVVVETVVWWHFAVHFNRLPWTENIHISNRKHL